ncbi:MAG: ribonuclease Y [Chloroflexi bacterium]|nr:ribonuclease Y [Chloroflexota bacterium]MBP8055224.1 ribonuclease Y [Chloroflexota bacterium]
MDIVIGIIIGLLVGGGAAAGLVWYFLKPQTDAIYAKAHEEADARRRTADQDAENLLAKAEQEVKHSRAEAETLIERRFKDIARAEERIDRRQSQLDKQIQKIEIREQNLNRRQSKLDKRQQQMDEFEEQRQAELEKVANMTQEEAKQELLTAVEAEARQDMARVIRQIEDEAKESAEVKARSLVALAVQRIATDQVAEMVVSVVPIPNEEMKGRIIGRNGRNIRAFEIASGVDIVVDDTPEAVTVSSFDPVRREVARRALEKLISDGRIHPARIEKSIKDSTAEVNKVIKDAGEEAAFEANVHGLHPEIIKMLGRLKFRTSYGQNQLYHAVEASKLASILAAELGLEVDIAKTAALLHDLGKAMDHDQEGTHAMLGAEFIKRFNVHPTIVNAVASHHHEVDQESIEAIIVEVADAISGARPGARRESLENYIKRVRTLEEIAMSFKGVEGAYALQAGREIRIFVKPDKIDDLAAIRLSKDIAKTVEDSMQYPGQIQVTVIRETRAVNFAK